MKALFVLTVLIIGGCSLQVKTYQKPGVSISAYETWCWVGGCDMLYQGPKEYLDQRVLDEIANAIASNLYTKGYIQGDDQADLMVNYYLVVEKEEQEVKEPQLPLKSYEVGFRNVDSRWLKDLYPEHIQFLKGSLIIDVIDRKKSELIWHSSVVGYSDLKPEFKKEAIWDAVNEGMKKFPYHVNTSN